MLYTYQYFTKSYVYFKSKLVGAISYIDSRFGLYNKPLNINKLQFTLVALFQSYRGTIKNLGIRTWLVHVTLLRYH